MVWMAYLSLTLRQAAAVRRHPGPVEALAGDATTARHLARVSLGRAGAAPDRSRARPSISTGRRAPNEAAMPIAYANLGNLTALVIAALDHLVRTAPAAGRLQRLRDRDRRATRCSSPRAIQPLMSMPRFVLGGVPDLRQHRPVHRDAAARARGHRRAIAGRPGAGDDGLRRLRLGGLRLRDALGASLQCPALGGDRLRADAVSDDGRPGRGCNAGRRGRPRRRRTVAGRRRRHRLKTSTPSRA